MGFDIAPIQGPTEHIDYRKLIEKDRIHGRLYTSDTVFRDELEKIFYRGWVYVGHECEIPNPGDYVTRMIGLEPVVLVRNREGAVRVLSNRCIHRGSLICNRARGSAKSLVCEYHGWSYTLDGDLQSVTYPSGSPKDKTGAGLGRPAMVESYQGFVFASFNPEAGTLAAHLGKARVLLDRAVGMSPAGRIDLSAGWAKHRFRANWKMLAENDTDGYHAVSVHSSFLWAFRSQYDDIMVSDDKRKSRARDWGQGHLELDYSPTYEQPLEWLGTTEEKAKDYVQAMTAAYGEVEARKRLIDGPPHALIFPNLFLGELNIVMFQPLSANECVQWHTPMLLQGAPDDINTRAIRQSAAAMGPAAFLLADDAVISEQQQIALRDRGGWLDLSRGLEREQIENGVLSGNHTDETTNRGFWRHYLSVMER